MKKGYLEVGKGHKIYFEEEINKKKKTLSADDLVTVKKLLAILDKAAQKQGERLDIAGEIIELQELQNQRDSLSQVEYFIKNNQAKEALEEIVDYEKKYGNDEAIRKLRTVAQELKKSNPLGVESKPIELVPDAGIYTSVEAKEIADKNVLQF